MPSNVQAKKKMRTAGWKVSSTHLEETEDQPTDEEKSPPPKKSPMVAYEPQIPPGNLIREVDILMAQSQGFGTPVGSSLHGSRSSSPMNYSLHASGSGPIKNRRSHTWSLLRFRCCKPFFTRLLKNRLDFSALEARPSS